MTLNTEFATLFMVSCAEKLVPLILLDAECFSTVTIRLSMNDRINNTMQADIISWLQIQKAGGGSGVWNPNFIGGSMHLNGHSVSNG